MSQVDKFGKVKHCKEWVPIENGDEFVSEKTKEPFSGDEFDLSKSKEPQSGNEFDSKKSEEPQILVKSGESELSKSPKAGQAWVNLFK
ncbi:hypothetical protein HanIR_Chr02g0090331 [Helianthus annuus]|nr:hypothetical protein HanIR_Chr02g0090331 [Helianthus annuus]